MKRSAAIYKSTLLAGLMCLCLYSPGLSADIELSSALDKTDIAFEDSVILRVELKWQGDIRNYSFGLLPLPQTSNLQVVGTSSSIASREEDGVEITVRTFKYSFKPTLSGTGTIEPITIDYVAWPDSIPGQLTTQTFRVLIANPLPPPEVSNLPNIILIALGLLIVVAIVIIVLVKRKKVETKPVKTAEQYFLSELAQIKKESQNDRKIFFTRLFRTLSLYIENKYSIDLSGHNAIAVGALMEKMDVHPDIVKKLGGWLKQAETEKFAPVGGTPGDIIRLISELENYFKKTNIEDISEAL